MIHCVNLNATLDELFVLPSLSLGGVNRAVATLSYPGGKGNNAARAVALLGGKARLHAFTSLKERSMALSFFRGRGVEAKLTAVGGSYRPCLVILDAERNQETVVNSASQLKVGAAALARLKAGLLKGVQAGDIVTFSGSIPEGLREDSYASLIKAVVARGGVALLDAYGPALRLGVEAAPFMVKPNAEELGEAFGVPTATRDQVIRAGRALLRKGVRCVIVTLGDHGAVCVTQREVLYATPLPTPRGLISPVGCGDAFLGAMARGLERGWELSDCLRLATAAAWANLGVPGAVFFDPKLVKAQIPLVKISRLAS
ncbi:MAG TPA: hexose kinase [bacterium]|jgi:1-phosphofructokinase family hexose kinase|nr:hexose kinase [bacterium]